MWIINRSLVFLLLLIVSLYNSEFCCDDGNFVVADNFVCDGYPDCDDHSDEQQCESIQTYGSNNDDLF